MNITNSLDFSIATFLRNDLPPIVNAVTTDEIAIVIPNSAGLPESVNL